VLYAATEQHVAKWRVGISPLDGTIDEQPCWVSLRVPGLALLGCAGFAAAGVLLGSSSSGNSLIAEYIAPDGKSKVIVFVRDCGEPKTSVRRRRSCQQRPGLPMAAATWSLRTRTMAPHPRVHAVVPNCAFDD